MNERPGVAAAFFKGHGLGNDYLVFDSGDAWWPSAAAVRAVCDPHRGVGSDGIVVVAAMEPVVALRMFNPDGSEFERSGNGLRIAAAALFRRGLVGTDPFPVETGGGTAVLQIHRELAAGAFDASAVLGRARVGPEAVGLELGALMDGGTRSPSLGGGFGGTLSHPTRGVLHVVPVSVGNPHLVVFTEDLTDEALSEIGPHLVAHPALASGANVQLARVEADGIRIRIWERGVGRTDASGTSASAVAVAAVAGGRCASGTHTVFMDGGEFQIEVSADLDVTLRGPVSEVFVGELSAGFLEGLAG